ncbi:MAG: tetratricopeptide repeat protein [Planctomycetota bacterium]|jgi:hypothetical protein
MNKRTLLSTLLVAFLAGGLGASTALLVHGRPEAGRVSGPRTHALRDLHSELDELRREVRRQAARPSPAPAEPLRGPAPTAGAADEKPPADLTEFERLRRRVFAWEATSEERQRFWELARTSELLPKLIDRLKAAVKKAPDNVSARLELAGAYVAKLYTVPNGPERGAYATLAEAEWVAVLKRDDANWEARSSLAFSLSQWPAYFNKRPAAIREFETLLAKQETARPEAREVGAFAQLARLYRENAEPKKAAEVVRRGLERHPDAKALRALLGPAAGDR